VRNKDTSELKVTAATNAVCY